mgnify:CR=1 FL=1
MLFRSEAAYPTLAKRFQIGSTRQGRPIWALKISDNVALDENETPVLFDGNIHAREFGTPEVCLHIINDLLTTYATNPTRRAWVDNLEIYVIACLNPDGRNVCDSINANWRKNARDNNGNGIFDANYDGVDLNRNATFLWGSDNLGSSPNPWDITYRGPSAGSEPETQAFLSLLRRIRPAFHLTIHSYQGSFLTPYADVNAVSPQPEQVRSLGASMAAVSRTENGEAYAIYGNHQFVYTVNGDTSDEAYAHQGAFSVVVEIGVSGFQPLYATTRDKIIPGLRPGWEKLLAAAYDSHPRLHGRILDALGRPVPARIDLLDITRPNDEHWETRWDGRYDAPMRAAGTYRLRVTPLARPAMALERSITFDAGPVRWDIFFGADRWIIY